MYKDGQETDNAEICARVTESQRLYFKENKMAGRSEGPSKQRKCRPWTETELKYFAIVLADEKNEFGYKLDTLALKKTANKGVFEEIKMALEELMSSEEFKEENEREHAGSKSKKDLTPLKIDVEKLRNKFKWLKDQWRRYTDRIKKGSGKSPIQEPEWYRIINPIFSDTHGNMEVASQASDVLSDDPNDSETSDTDEAVGSHSGYQEDDESADLPDTSDSGKQTATKRKVEVKPLNHKKRIRSQSQAMNEIAKSFQSLGESQQQRCEKMMEADKERHTEFLAFQKEQAELNRQHELKMLEIIMKYSNLTPQGVPQQPPQQQTMLTQPHAPPQYYSSMAYSHTPPPHHVQARGSQDSHILDIESQHGQPGMTWY